MSPVNGNDYVGVGELNPSRPKPFFWHDPTLHPYGDMQHYTLRVMFGVPDAGQHYHVPLLISAFGYSTYRGS